MAQLVLEGLLQELDEMVPRVQQVMKQARARIYRGDTHAEGKIVSLFEPSTEVIRKGKAAKPNEFGKMIKLQEAENQIVIDYEVYDRRPNDSDLLIPALETHQARFSRMPYLVAADAAFYSGKNEAAAKAKGVKRKRSEIVHDAAGPRADALKPDRNGEADRDLEREFGKPAARPVDVAVVHQVAQLKKTEQHREQDRGGVDHAGRHIVTAAAQQLAAQPERGRGDAVAVEQPVEDRRRADVGADDARLPADPQDHQDDDRGRARTSPPC